MDKTEPVNLSCVQPAHSTGPFTHPPGAAFSMCGWVGAGLILLLFAASAHGQPLDPRCHDRSATGQFDCRIDKPVVTQHETVYPTVQFAPNDIVEVKADGCVQTGGWGDTWKRYVNPVGGDIAHLYHGLIRIPTAKPMGDGLVRIEKVMGKRQTVTGVGLPVSQLVLHLGYEDDDYSDNGYSNPDNGNYDQCKTDWARGIDGGPAHVTITIYRGVSPAGAPTSRFDFNVVSSSYDRNGIPYNPWWAWQLRPENRGQKPDTSLCHNFSRPDTLGGIPSPIPAPYFADCTDQADLTTVDVPQGWNSQNCRANNLFGDTFPGHVNWFPVTVEGTAGWGDHSTWDDDYTFTFTSQEEGNPLSVNGRDGLHIEFDSDETIDHFASEEWAMLRAAVDSGSKDRVIQLLDGHTILTGMFGLDGEHRLKAELHPLYALATKRDNYENDPRDEVWLIFVRNRGDEGYCSSQLWDGGFEDYTFRLPWLPDKTSVEVNWSKTNFEGTDGTSGPTVVAVPFPLKDAGVYVTFHLGPAASGPFIDGALHLAWSGSSAGTLPSVTVVGGASREAGHRGPLPPPSAAGEVNAVEHMLQAAMNHLTPLQRTEVAKARAAAGARSAVHRLPPGGPVRMITALPAVARIARLHAIKAGPAARKAERDAAQMRALCAATHNAPAGLPAGVCTSNVRDHR